MKRIFLLLFVFWYVIPCFAQLVDKIPITISGVIIDNACVAAHKEDLRDFIKTHTKECAISKNSVESGYSIFAYGELLKFDKESNVKIAKFLKLPKSRLNVDVVVDKRGDVLKLISIQSQR